MRQLLVQVHWLGKSWKSNLIQDITQRRNIKAPPFFVSSHDHFCFVSLANDSLILHIISSANAPFLCKRTGYSSGGKGAH